ncbi:protein ALP1-like [Penaeus chinensis]|uniref:protein ALP1-like n=1 Tax=Penaeus chinensis TaxID=139456 RepID=UPI001FB60797|nr:protein ALP1-like [Penaeus chinensis]
MVTLVLKKEPSSPRSGDADTKQDTKLRNAIPPIISNTLLSCYRQSRRALAWSYRMSHNLIAAIIPEVCKAIYSVLKDSYLKLPTTSEEWQDVASGFHNLWNFPLCLGAMDGKRVLVRKPANSGSEYYDYKTNHSIIMLALVDANYKFLYVDVGAKGRASDAGVWDKCTLRECIERQQLQIPPSEDLPFTNTKAPYVIVSDDAFPLKTYLMKPYPGRNITKEQTIFNYRLSRARRVSENAFGILASKFRVLMQPIASKPDNIKDIIMATVVLHNFLRVKSGKPVRPEMLVREDTENGVLIQGEWHGLPNMMENLQAIARGHSNDAKIVRDTFREFFLTRGAVPWQERMAHLH